jgi:ABC-type thiamin/hydroxymethylpyrimidine transport system permease subunit
MKNHKFTGDVDIFADGGTVDTSASLAFLLTSEVSVILSATLLSTLLVTLLSKSLVKTMDFSPRLLV